MKVDPDTLTNQLHKLPETDLDRLINTFLDRHPWNSIERSPHAKKINTFVEWVFTEKVEAVAFARAVAIQEGVTEQEVLIHEYLEKTLRAQLEEATGINKVARVRNRFVAPSASARKQRGIWPGFLAEDLHFPTTAAEICLPEESFRGEPEYVPDILERLQNLDKVALLGEPGAGKTFLLARLALEYADAYATNSLLPLYVPLSRYDTDADFMTFCGERLGPLTKLLPSLNVVWLLDALNEMPRRRGQWEHLKEFLLRLKPTNTRFVLTCRVKNYHADLAHIPGLHRVELQDLNPVQIYAILQRYLPEDPAFPAPEPGKEMAEWIWDEALRGQGVREAWEAWAATGGSVRAFWERPSGYSRPWDAHERVRSGMHNDARKLLLLCRNPFTLVHLLIPKIYKAVADLGRQVAARQAIDNALPANRAALFGEVIEQMLTKEAKEHPWREEDGENAKQHRWMAGDVKRVERLLESVAAAIQAQEQRTEMPVADLPTCMDWPLDGEWLLHKGRDASLVTLPDGEGGVRFTHQLFQEYFATGRLRKLLEDFDRRHSGWEAGPELPPRDERLAELFPRWWDVGGWRITVALLGEKAAHLGEQEARQEISRIVRWLSGFAPEIALHCVLDNNDGVQLKELSPQARGALVEGAQERVSEGDPVGRAAAYRVLGHPAIDADRRPGIGLSEGLPDIAYGKRILAGSYRVGGDDRAWKSLPAQTVKLDYSYCLSKYPITNAQFQCFLEAPDGYRDADRWFQDLAADSDDRVVRDPYFPYINHPRETVNWYQAMAFCRWLSWRKGGIYSLDRVLDWPVRLPTELEWEIACRGEQGFVYPYAGEFDPGKGNTYETGIGRTSAVGIFPEGASPYGLLDMSGNVWEWCLTAWNEKKVGSNDPAGTASRVLRGGSWYDDAVYTRAAARYDADPNFRIVSIGFRVVCLPH